jgi:hypothetical protein
MAADEYSSIFTTGPSPDPGVLTYPQLEARRRIAIALATRNRPYPKTIGEGLTALGEGLGEGYMNRGLEGAEAAMMKGDTAARQRLYGDPAAAPAAPGRVSEAAPEEAAPALASAADAQPSMPIEEWKQRVARNESGGQRDPYSALGELSRRGDRAYGKYQVMGENVPKWTKQFVGREMTPEEFLADKDAQETVASGMGGKYLAKYGPDGAARAWFAGEKGMNDPNRKDTLGTHVAEYSRRFNIPLVSRDQVVASAARQPDAFTTAPEMSPEAAGAMAYAPEGAASEGATGLGAGMLANLTNPQPPGLGLRGPSDSTFPAPAPPAVSRDSIAASVAAQNGIVPPQQVAQAGPAPLPQVPPAAPPATARPTIAPSTAASLEQRPVPAGPQPQFETFLNDPRLKPMMDEARRTMSDPRVLPATNALAEKRLGELHELAKDAYGKAWTVWHERNAKEDAFRLDAEARQRARETHGVTMAEAPYKIETARKAAEPTTKEVEGRILERHPETGKWEDVTPGGSLPNLTEAQGKDLGFYQRAKWAMHNLGDGKELTDFAKWHAAGMPLIGNYAVDGKFQRQLQAANELTAVQLRLETGTAAPPAELKNVIDRLVPRPGDKPEAQLQKEQLRASLVKSYADVMGSKGQPYIEKFNREFELDKKEYDKKQNALLPPIKVDNPELVDMLPPGRRWIAPDGKMKQK